MALWREGLLARAVLRSKPRGYRNHPQLERFHSHPTPVSAINHYLRAVADEADRRGHDFDRGKLGPVRDRSRLPVSQGQLAFEVDHLRSKLNERAPDEVARLSTASDEMSRSGTTTEPHPLLKVHPGPVEPWERGGRRGPRTDLDAPRVRNTRCSPGLSSPKRTVPVIRDEGVTR